METQEDIRAKVCKSVNNFLALSLEKRQKQADDQLKRHADRLPLIIYQDMQKSKQTLPWIKEWKFLIPRTMTMADVSMIIRGRTKLSKEQALFLFVGKSQLVPATQLISEVYAAHKAEDGFLYVVYLGEDTFGFTSSAN